MTITLAWWALPLFVAVAGIVGALIISSRAGGAYDFVTPLIAFGAMALGVVAAVGILIGRWIS